MKRLLALTFLAAAALPAVAFAAIAQSTLTVQATVVASCRIDPQTLNFGNYDGTLNQGSADITITCNAITPHWVGIDSGLSGVRQMTMGASTLGYELYRDATRTTVWDNADPGGGPYTWNDAGSTHTVYGEIAAGQIVPVGAYSQIVTMTVNF